MMMEKVANRMNEEPRRNVCKLGLGSGLGHMCFMLLLTHQILTPKVLEKYLKIHLEMESVDL